MSTPERAIAILACLAPMTGTRSTGIATVKSTGPTGALPAGVYAFPVLRGQCDFTRPFRVDTHATPTSDGATAITSSGTDVPITSVLGGEGLNLAADTPLVWFPSNDGIEAISVVKDDMTGGAGDSSPFAVKSCVWFEEPAKSQLADDFIRAAMRTTPAIIVSWSSRAPTTKNHGPKSFTRTDRWSALVVCSKTEAHHTRGLQALQIVDMIEAELGDRASVDGLVLSSPPIKVNGVQRVDVGAGFYAFAVSFETSISIESTDDTKRAAYAAWSKTSFTLPTMLDEGDPTLAVVDSATYPQP